MWRRAHRPQSAPPSVGVTYTSWTHPSRARPPTGAPTHPSHKPWRVPTHNGDAHALAVARAVLCKQSLRTSKLSRMTLLQGAGHPTSQVLCQCCMQRARANGHMVLRTLWQIAEMCWRHRTPSPLVRMPPTGSSPHAQCCSIAGNIASRHVALTWLDMQKVVRIAPAQHLQMSRA